MQTFSKKFRTFGVVVAICSLIGLSIFVFSGRVSAQYPGNKNHVISLDQAAALIQNFKKSPTAPTIQGGYFDRNIFDKILAQQGCVGIRYYYAADSTGSPTVVLVGVDSAGNDMEQGILGEWVQPCPPYCSSPNQLNK